MQNGSIVSVTLYQCGAIIVCVCVLSERPWTESLSARIAEVQDAFKNIPQMLYFAPSSIALDGIGVYAAETLPKGSFIYCESLLCKRGKGTYFGSDANSAHISLLEQLQP